MNSKSMGAPSSFEYSVRVSPRARRVTLRITPQDGLVVVIPRSFKKDRVPAIVESRRAWIEKAFSKARPPVTSKEEASPPPAMYLFPSVGRLLELPGDGIHLCLRDLAAAHLVPWAWEISRETGLSPGKFAIRNQKSIWGSCSAKGNISLNQKLLFLESHIVRYVMIHELCHLEHKNHSPRFWAFLKGFDPQYPAHRRELRKAQWTVPAWAH